MHTKSVDLPADIPFDIFVEEIPHKTTIYVYPRIMIYFAGPCDLEIVRDGNRIVVRGCVPIRTKSLKKRFASRSTKSLK